jgi:hypothetical protein
MNRRLSLPKTSFDAASARLSQRRPKTQLIQALLYLSHRDVHSGQQSHGLTVLYK